MNNRYIFRGKRKDNGERGLIWLRHKEKFIL